ncbi:hypothetical protein, partial [Pseudoponticoccus marisrubri]|uniref:hypothetical protein n=1 Tax=Pseudoponticoccus marisrubri TaxID=1685382 RepID=UPI001969E64A
MGFGGVRGVFGGKSGWQVSGFADFSGLVEEKMTNPEKTACGVLLLGVDTPSPAALRRCTGRRPERTGR